MEFDAKGVPKWNQNRYQNSSKINAKTGTKKDQEHHQTLYFCECEIHCNKNVFNYLEGW